MRRVIRFLEPECLGKILPSYIYLSDNSIFGHYHHVAKEPNLTLFKLERGVLTWRRFIRLNEKIGKKCGYKTASVW